MAQHGAQRFQGAGITLSVESDRGSFPDITVGIVQQVEERIHDAGISGRTDLGGDDGAHCPVWVPECGEGEINRAVDAKPNQRGDRLCAGRGVRVGLGHRLERLCQAAPFVGIEVVMPATPDPGARVDAAVTAGVTEVRDRAVNGGPQPIQPHGTRDTRVRGAQSSPSRWPATPYPRRRCPTEAVHTAVRVNVRCVTPLGEDVASIS
jgi:hypothetical protein